MNTPTNHLNYATASGRLVLNSCKARGGQRHLIRFMMEAYWVNVIQLVIQTKEPTMESTAFACGSKSKRYYVTEVSAVAGIPVKLKIFFIAVAPTDREKTSSNTRAVQRLIHSQVPVIVASHSIPHYLLL